MAKFWRLSMLSLALSLAALAMAAAFVALPLETRLAEARYIAVGEISNISVVARNGEPWTLVQMQVERWFRFDGRTIDPQGEANLPPDVVTAAFWGGALESVAPLTVAGIPTFSVGERILWLLREPDAGLGAASVGVTQGVFRSTELGWRGDDGSLLSLDERGELRLEGVGGSDQLIFEALQEALPEVNP
jgi:hypothetical protein